MTTEEMTNQTLKGEISESIRLCWNEIIQQLQKAARDEGITIDKNAVAVGASSTGIIVNAAVAGLANIDMIRYEDGMLTNFVYVDSTETSLPSGFYTVTTVARFIKPGRIDIRGNFSQRGELVAVSPGVALITSLRVPPNVTPSVVTGLSLTQLPDDPLPGIGVPLEPVIYTQCSNGGWWCVRVPSMPPM